MIIDIWLIFGSSFGSLTDESGPSATVEAAQRTAARSESCERRLDSVEIFLAVPPALERRVSPEEALSQHRRFLIESSF